MQLTKLLSFRLLELRFPPRGSHWSRVWASSIAMSRWLLTRPQRSLPRSAKELGCGLGLVSLTLAHLGVRSEGTDREAVALALTAENADRNALVGVTVSHLDWSEPTGGAVALVVASDVLYDQGSPGRLFTLLQTHGLLSPGGQLLVSGPRARPFLLDELVVTLEAVGYAHDVDCVPVDWNGRTEEVDVHLLRRPP